MTINEKIDMKKQVGSQTLKQEFTELNERWWKIQWNDFLEEKIHR